MRGLYFIEHGLSETQSEGLFQAFQESLAPIGLQLYEAEDGTYLSTSLMEACQKAFLSTLGVFDLSRPSPDAYLEIGISLGLNKPALIIAGQGVTSSIPPIIDRAHTWFYTPPLQPNQDIQRFLERCLKKWAQTKQNALSSTDGDQVHCVFCDRLCRGWQKQTHGKGYLLLDGSHPQWNAWRSMIRSGLSPTGLTPIYLSQFKGRVMPLLCEIRLAVLASEFVLLDLSAPCNPEQYIALGMAISMRRTWILLTSQPEKLPRLLRQCNRLEYANNQELRKNLERYALKTIYPARFASAIDATAQLELAFWQQLEDWIARFEDRTSQVMEGTLQLLLIEEGQLRQRCQMTSDTTITAGRDSVCDLVIETQGASRLHAEFIFTGRELMVIDCLSMNGTFVNGNRLPPGVQSPLEVGDHVRIGPAEVVVWNEDELPERIKQYLPESGRVPPQTIFVNLGDGLVLANGKVPIARLSSSEIALLEFMHKKGDATTTTGEAAEIVFGSGEISRMIVASIIDGLRAKIEPIASDPRFLMPVPGRGYRLRTRGGQLVVRAR